MKKVMQGAQQIWAEVDIAVFTVRDNQLHLLLVKRPEDSSAFPGVWALPGGALTKYLGEAGSSREAAMLELRAKTGAEAPYLEQLGTFDGKDRDPRGWTVSIVYFALIPYDRVSLKAEARWWPVKGHGVGTKLAFDHAEILQTAVQRLRSKLEYTAIAGHLLGEEFTLPQLKAVYDIILDEEVPEMSFRRNAERSGVLEETGGLEESKGHRRAKLYRFTRDARTALFFPRSLVRSAEKTKKSGKSKKPA